MSDSPLDKVPAHNRVSIRAVLVHEGEDASAALAEAGFAETITVPVVLGEQPGLPGGILGNGITPNVTAVLETEQEEETGASVDARQRSTRLTDAGVHPKRSDTTTLPAAYGMQPLAPVRRTGDVRKHPNVAAEPQGDHVSIDPPLPGRSVEEHSDNTSNGMSHHADAENEPIDKVAPSRSVRGATVNEADVV